jgi:hypothetical protein
MLPHFRDGMWFVDFEYSRPDDREAPEIVCMTALEAQTGFEIRMFKEELLSRTAAPFPTGENACVVAYSAGAEGSAFAALSWPDPVNVVDPYAEHLRDINGRPDRYKGDARLLEARQRHGLPVRSQAYKEAMQDKATHQKHWPEPDRVEMLDYCMEDNHDTLGLVREMDAKDLINWPQALWRGRFMFLSGSHIEHRPLLVDIESYREIEAAFPRLNSALLESVDYFGVFEDGRRREKQLNKLIADAGLAEVWPRTETGRFEMGDDTWKEMVALQPPLAPLRRALLLRQQLEPMKFAIGSDRRNRFWTGPLRTKTGRSNLTVAENILAAPKWWRGLLITEEGKALVECDFSNEEIWIVATTSGCPVLLRDVAASDIHLATAISVGLIPPGGDAETYKAERNRIKPLTHGTNYGISAYGIRRQLGIPLRQAARILRAFDDSHPVFRAWQRGVQLRAYATGRIEAPMGWAMHVDETVNPRTLLNWYPQTVGGEILRAAVVMLVTHGFRVCATAHDSVYLEIPLDGLAERIALAKELMSSVTLPFTGGYLIPTKAHVVLPGDRLLDNETRPTWDLVTALVRAGSPVKSPRNKISNLLTGENLPSHPREPGACTKEVYYG